MESRDQLHKFDVSDLSQWKEKSVSEGGTIQNHWKFSCAPVSVHFLAV